MGNTTVALPPAGRRPQRECSRDHRREPGGASVLTLLVRASPITEFLANRDLPRRRAQFGPAQTVRKGRACLSHQRRVRRCEISRSVCSIGRANSNAPTSAATGFPRSPNMAIAPMRPIANGFPGFRASETFSQLPPAARTEERTWSASLPETPPEQISKSKARAARAICLVSRLGSSGQHPSVCS